MAKEPEQGGDGAGLDEDDDLARPADSGPPFVMDGATAADGGPLVCALKGAGDAVAGAIMGSVFGFGSGMFKRQGFKVALREAGSSAKTFALLSGVHSAVACYLRRIRGVEDAINAGIAGCATGLALSTPGTPQALLQSCLSFGVFSYVLDNLNKPRAALASTGARHGIVKGRSLIPSMQCGPPVLPPFTLPPPMFAGPFSLFCTDRLQAWNQHQQFRPW